MDLGIGKFLEMFEKRFGVWPTTVLLGLIGLGLAVLMIDIISTGLAAFAGSASGFFGLLTGGVTLENVGTLVVTITLSVVLFGAAMVIALIVLARTVNVSRVKQGALDALSELRTEGIDEVWAKSPTSDQQLTEWDLRRKDWERRVLELVETRFQRADFLNVASLGEVTPSAYGHAYNVGHARLLSYVARRLEVIESMLASYRR